MPTPNIRVTSVYTPRNRMVFNEYSEMIYTNLTSMTPSMMWRSDPPPRENQRVIRNRIRNLKRAERESVLRFLNTGISGSSNITAVRDRAHKRIKLVGKGIEGVQTILYLKDKVLTVNQNRVNQYRKDIEAFAAYQGFELVFTDRKVEPMFEGVRIMVHCWPKRVEVDDTALLTTQLRPLEGTPEDDNNEDPEETEDSDYCCEECTPGYLPF